MLFIAYLNVKQPPIRPGCILRCGAGMLSLPYEHKCQWMKPPSSTCQIFSLQKSTCKRLSQKSKTLSVCHTYYLELSPHVHVVDHATMSNVIINSKNVLVISYNPNLRVDAQSKEKLRWREKERKKECDVYHPTTARTSLLNEVENMCATLHQNHLLNWPATKTEIRITDVPTLRAPCE
jgi:hypothetical protein